MYDWIDEWINDDKDRKEGRKEETSVHMKVVFGSVASSLGLTCCPWA